MESIIVHPRNQKDQETIEAFLKALDIPFHKQEESPFERSYSSHPGKSNPKNVDEIWKLE